MRIIKGILRRIPDPRQAGKIKYPLVEILMLSIIAITAGANSSLEIETFARNRKKWLRRYMALKNGIPSRLTIERVLRLLSPKALQKAYVEIIAAIREEARHSGVRRREGPFSSASGAGHWRCAIYG